MWATVISKAVALANPYKIAIIAGIAFALVWGGWYARGVVADAAQLAAVKRAVAQAEEQYKEDMELFKKDQGVRTKIVTKFIEVEKDEASVVPECPHAGADWQRVFNMAIQAAK